MIKFINLIENQSFSHSQISVHLASDDSYFMKPSITYTDIDRSDLDIIETIRNLTPYTEFLVRVVACNRAGDNVSGTLLCARPEHAASLSFRTDIGRPGPPNPPTTSASYNRSIYILEWDTGFQVGGPASALEWILRIASESGDYKDVKVGSVHQGRMLS